GSRWGIAGIAMAWVVAYPLVAGPLYWKTFRSIGMKTKDYLAAVRPALDGSLAMIAVVLLLKEFQPVPRFLALRLISEVLVGAAAYTGTLLLFHRSRSFALFNQL